VSTVLAPPSSRAAPAARPTQSRVRPLLWLLGTQAILLISLAAWALLAGFSFLSAEGALLPGPLLWLLRAYPVIPLVCCTAAWIAFSRRDYARARTWTVLPLAAALPLLAFAWYMASPVG
jgi:hypothetical protein